VVIGAALAKVDFCSIRIEDWGEKIYFAEEHIYFMINFIFRQQQKIEGAFCSMERAT